MGMLALHDVFPELASKESRMLRPFNRPELPEDDYVLVEHYCVDPKCDCRRVVIGMFLGAPPPRQVATINHAFDVPTDGEPQTFLDPLNPQSDRSEPLLGLFLEMLKNDPTYIDRLKRHYRMVKEAAADPNHPAYRTMRDVVTKDPGYLGPRTVVRSDKKVGRNDPCPCGSGKKYKKCCSN